MIPLAAVLCAEAETNTFVFLPISVFLSAAVALNAIATAIVEISTIADLFDMTPLLPMDCLRNAQVKCDSDHAALDLCRVGIQVM
jgi:hypothetical protein